MRKRKPNENKDRGGQFCVETAQRWRWRRQRERRWCNSSGGTVETSVTTVRNPRQCTVYKKIVFLSIRLEKEARSHRERNSISICMEVRETERTGRKRKVRETDKREGGSRREKERQVKQEG